MAPWSDDFTVFLFFVFILEIQFFIYTGIEFSLKINSNFLNCDFWTWCQMNVHTEFLGHRFQLSTFITA